MRWGYKEAILSFIVIIAASSLTAATKAMLDLGKLEVRVNFCTDGLHEIKEDTTIIKQDIKEILKRM